MFFHKKQNFYSSNLGTYIENLQKGDLWYIPWIFCVFAENSIKHKLKASQALSKALKSLSCDDICRMDIRMRETISMEWSIDWRTLSIKDFITKQMSEDERRAVLVFASFNPNGYIRQQAVALLASYCQTLPFILLRFNDWVYPVRQYALTTLSEKIKVASDEEVVDALPFVEKLRKSERGKYGSIHSLMVSKLDGNKALIEKGLISQDVRARQFCVFVLADLTTVDNTVLLAHIKNEKDPFLRRIIFQLLLKTNTDIEKLSKQLLKDTYPPNRILALQSLCNYKSIIALNSAENMLLDKNAQVRTLARNIISQNGGIIDFHQFYLNNLSENTSISLYGLGETGSCKDCPLIMNYLADNRISVIRAAMMSLMHLDSQSFLSRITEMLSSDYVGIVKTTALLLRKYGGYDFERVFEIQESSSYEATKIKCASLLFLASKWKSLIYILMLVGSGYEILENVCQFQINKWIVSYNRSYQVVSEKESQTIKALVSAKKRFLKPQVEKQLLFLSK